MPTASQAPVAAAQRLDLYAGVHKALRLCMAETLTRLGSADPQDDAECNETLAAVQQLLSLCASHLAKEDGFVHPLLDAALPGSAARAKEEHLHHQADLERIGAMTGELLLASASERASGLTRLYRELAVFVAENFQHMAHEESAHNAALWASYTDDELRSVEQRLVASIPPAVMMAYLPWFIRALAPMERAQMLAGMRASAPPAVFEAVLGIARARLPQRDFGKLAERLGVPVEAAAVSAAPA